MKPQNNDRKLFVNLSAATVLGVINIIYATSFASLLFSGSLTQYIPLGVGILLLSNAVSALILAVGSSIPGVISTFKGAIVAIMAVMATSIASSTAPEQTLPTIVAAITIGTVATGLCLFLLGVLNLGNLIRFIPHPVMGGFFAGVGFLIVEGALPVMMDIPLTPANLSIWFEAKSAILWGPGLIFGLLMLAIERRYDSPLRIPMALIFSIGLFYAVLFVTGTTLDQAQAIGLLLGDFSSGDFLPFMELRLWQEVNVSVLADQYGNILAVMMMSAISSLLLISAIEVGTGREVNLEKDLKAAGAANMVTGVLGGVVSFHTAADTVLGYRLGAKSVTVGVFFGLICAVFLLMGQTFITLFPKFIMAGLLLYQGLTLIIDWAYKSWRRMPGLDYFLLLAIFCVVVSLGFLKGVSVGILIAVVFFVVNYGRTGVFRHILTGDNLRSNVERTVSHQELLQQKGEYILILSLQGYIFFGSAYKILSEVKNRLSSTKGSKVKFIVLDFNWVTNIDMSAVNMLLKLKQLAYSKEIMLIFSNINKEIEEKLMLVDYFPKGVKQNSCMQLPDLDRALERCEDQILSWEGTQEKRDVPLEEHLRPWFSREEMVTRFMGYLEEFEVDGGRALFRQGDPPDGLYILISGRISIHLEKDGQERIRLLTMRKGSVIGEMGLYTSSGRTATAVAEIRSRVGRLSVESFNKMQEEAPEVSAQFHKFIVTLLSKRIARGDQAMHLLFH